MRVKGQVPLPHGVADDSFEAIVCTWYGVGLIKKAPGTWGSLAALVAGLIALKIAGGVLLAVFAVTVAVVGVWTCQRFIDRLDDGVDHDQQVIVVDEVAGQLIALIPIGFVALPLAETLLLWLVAFLLFRLFDIWKPGPIGWIDRQVEGGLGIMGDDILAGLVAAVGVAVLAAVL